MIEKTDKFSATLGVNRGYFHNNEQDVVLFDLGAMWQQEALKIFTETNCYVSCVIDPTYAIYNEEWGCPKGGETTISITGERNPTFITDSELYKECVRRVLIAMMERLWQTTTQLTFTEVEFVYLVNEKIKKV